MTDSRHNRTYYIGLCSTYHDPALAILDGSGQVLFAEATERFLQYKRALNCEPDNPFLLPALLQKYCPDAGAFVVAGNWRQSRPWFEHLARMAGWFTPSGILQYRGRQVTASLETWQLNHMLACQHHALQRSGINLARTLRQHYPDVPVIFRHYDHHRSHASLACYGSGFNETRCAVIDSYGEHGSLAFFDFSNGRLKPLATSRGPQSLGFFYMKLTELCGFDWLGGEEWKVMGLAPYGKVDESLLACMRKLFRVDGLDLRQNRAEFFPALQQLEARRRQPGAPPETVADLARTGQAFFIEIINKLLINLYQQGHTDALALVGGCALNSSCTGQIVTNTPFDRLYVPPAPADDGTALGAAWLAFHEDHPEARTHHLLSPYLGSAVDEQAIRRLAQYSSLPVQHYPDGGVIKPTAKLLAEGKIVGWMQGRAEFGPRGLGNRSILADPRPDNMGDRVNEKVKFREAFRPYAPAILDEHGPMYFENYATSPYMERTLSFRNEVRNKVPAVVHVDGTGRLQSVRADWNPVFHELLSEFNALTDVPVLLNTSFNVMGKPMVHGAEDAFTVFTGSGLDALAIGEYLFTKTPAG